jgi:CBS domain-containing protein
MAEQQKGPEGSGRRARENVAAFGRRGLHAATDAMRGSADAMREGARTGLEVSQQAAGDVTQQMGRMAEQLAQAAEVYGNTARRVVDECRGMMAAAAGLQEVPQAWTEWFSRTAETNARFSQEVLRARSPLEIAEIHSRFIEESLTGWRERGARVIEAASQIAAQAADQTPGEDDEEEQEGAPGIVRDVMARNIKVVGPEDTVEDVAKVMAKADTGVLPVGEEDKLVGMLTDRDIAVRLVAQGKDPAKTKVREVMTAEVKYCFEDEDLDHVAENMAEQRLRRLPVVNRDKRLVGMISVGDLATEAPDPHLAARALGGIAQSGGPHRQRFAARAGDKPKARPQGQRKPQRG